MEHHGLIYQKEINFMKKKLILGNLNDLYVLLNANGIKFSIVIFPIKLQYFMTTEILLIIKSLKIFVILNVIDFLMLIMFFDLVDKSSRKDVSKKYFIELDSHLNENGHEIVSKVILDNL